MRYYVVDDYGNVLAESDDKDKAEIYRQDIYDGTFDVEYCGELDIIEGE